MQHWNLRPPSLPKIFRRLLWMTLSRVRLFCRDKYFYLIIFPLNLRQACSLAPGHHILLYDWDRDRWHVWSLCLILDYLTVYSWLFMRKWMSYCTIVISIEWFDFKFRVLSLKVVHILAIAGVNLKAETKVLKSLPPRIYSMKVSYNERTLANFFN